MRFINNDNNTEISVEQVKGFGKKPGLWIKKEIDGVTTLVKMATFSNDKTAEEFVEYFTKFLTFEKERGGII